MGEVQGKKVNIHRAQRLRRFQGSKYALYAFVPSAWHLQHPVNI